nr:hypothetical protein [Tanacetum cinerariifolium]GFA67761.1 hypothetical protein [Tanacetum cinerariifolium]
MFSTNTSFLDLLSSFTPDSNSQLALPNDDAFGTFDECNSQYSDNNSKLKSDIGDESNDGSEVAAQSHSQGVINFMNDVGDASDEDADDKAWHSRRKAIETLYGTWESNFDMLPEYIAALEASNPNTVVKWFHDPYSSANGSYKGKLLVAVTKDANNNILAIAYAIVDEETAHSWSWFLYQFRHFVAHDRQLCVISDMHKGIIHAMSNMAEWKEPLAYHRFCLRHIRSNFMKKFNNLSLKRFCWSIGSTTQERKFVRYRREIKLNPET